MPSDLASTLVPLPWQVAPWRDKSSVLLLTGSAGGGKSYLAAFKPTCVLSHVSRRYGAHASQDTLKNYVAYFNNPRIFRSLTNSLYVSMVTMVITTMLAFFLTDADIKAPLLSEALKSAVNASFNSIIVDNDTSTNDTVLAFANGMSGASEIKAGTKEFREFTALLTSLSVELAQMIVRDGEGAIRLVEIEVKGAFSPRTRGAPCALTPSRSSVRPPFSAATLTGGASWRLSAGPGYA